MSQSVKFKSGKVVSRPADTSRATVKRAERLPSPLFSKLEESGVIWCQGDFPTIIN